MDSGLIFYILFGPALFALAWFIVAGINLLIRVMVERLTVIHAGRSERTYVRKHQRDTLPHGLL
ncbi:hypothetical protein DXT68_13840 [Microbacterium foliorum]|uniref:Uncharacterized protein n=1 Tax=Microbacterium foliorum TaxID=104336 RepID=A0A0F0KLL0_9MICO|nr:hypothetical protein [Microbacterium foliorum]AXL13093.1 hypothetical protein DXT68_13840 [Microbacterium foliorum]KJL21045.1 hypothetical protein RN50_01729 [Microbacterium foliorum]